MTSIYALVDPSTKAIGYVGASNHPLIRWRSHLTRSAAPRVREWIAAVATKGIEPEVLILQAIPEGVCTTEREAWWIQFLRERGEPLRNTRPPVPAPGEPVGPVWCECSNHGWRCPTAEAAQRRLRLSDAVSRAQEGDRLMARFDLKPKHHKAARLVAEGRISETEGRTFTVRGDHDTYTVFIPGRRVVGQGSWCSCPATETCSHILAALAVIESERDPFEGIGSESAVRGRAIRSER